MNASLCRIATLVAVAILVGRGAPVAGAAECQVPLFIQSGTIDANVMILFDNSGSMNEAMEHPDYDPFVTYTGPFVRDKSYYIASDGSYRPRDVPGRPSGANQYSPRAPLVDSFSGQDGRYRGNYLNWIFYVATDAQRAALPQECRIDVAHAVVSAIIAESEHVRFGLMRFNYDNGGTIVAQCGADKTTLINTVNNIEGDAWTPLGESLEDVLDYFKRTGAAAPIQASCQKSFCIVVTDGFPTKDRAVSSYLHDSDGDGRDPGNCDSIGSPDDNSNDCSDHMDDVAHYMYNHDLRPDLGWEGNNEVQNVVTYAIGFGVDARILGDTAENGHGLYLLAENAAELWNTLELVMQDIISRLSTGAAVAVVSTERGTDQALYRGKFMPGSWTGYLESYALPYADGDAPTWEAGQLLAAAGPHGRQIYTGLGGSQLNFVDGEAATLQSAMGLADAAVAADVIRWTRGEDVTNYRDRHGWILGDIVHSTPVVVGAPTGFTEDPDYQAFLAANANRTPMVYVGANDGMLHAFLADSGEEAWAFVPEAALPLLADVADTTNCHVYSVDLTPAVEDVKIGGAWRTLLVGGQRQGGCGYFALDVTAPTSPQLLWQAALPNGQPFSSEVEFAVIDGTAVALIGSGLDETSGRAYLEAYRVSDGAHLGSLLLSSDASRRNKATGARAVDLDLDGNHDLAYLADLQGHLWRVDFGDSPNPASWELDCLASGDVEITATPTPAHGEGGTVLVYVGTGAYLDTDDLQTDEDNAFLCVIDRHDGNSNPDLVDQTDGIHEVDGHDGWFVRLEHAAGERVTEPAVVVAGTVMFTSFEPDAEVCSAGGRSWLWRMDFADGSVPDDGEDDGWGGERSLEIGGGVASRPVVDVVNETVIVQSSDATITVQDIGQAFFHLTVRSWRETFEGNP